MENEFPKWVYGPNDQSKVIDCEEDRPEGWVDHPSQLSPAEKLDL